MTTISQFMSDDHRQCDHYFAVAEEAVSGGDWDGAGSAFTKFRELTETHFGMEEEVLFPAFEERTGMTEGPTSVMRMEHEEIRRLLEQLSMLLEDRAQDDFLGTAETLMIMLQQHNMKEEQMLYPMSEQQLGPESKEVLEQMQSFQQAATG